MFWHHKLVQTNTLLDSQTTNTHPSPHKKAVCSLGASVSMCTVRLATRRAGGCLLYIFVLIRATRSSSSLQPNHSRSERLSPLLAARQPGQQYTFRHPCAKRTLSQPHRPRTLGSHSSSVRLGKGIRPCDRGAFRQPAPRAPGSRCGHCPRPCRPYAGSHRPGPLEPTSHPADPGHRC